MTAYRSLAGSLGIGFVWLLGCTSVGAEMGFSSRWNTGAMNDGSSEPASTSACCGPTGARAGTWGPLSTGLVPPGNLAPRYPYSTWRTYYYDRPYNAMHVEQALAASPSNATAPYSNAAMSDVVRQVEQRVWERQRQRLPWPAGADDELHVLRQDGYLEYVDWEQHRAQRLEWEERSAESLPPVVPSSNQVPPSFDIGPTAWPKSSR